MLSLMQPFHLAITVSDLAATRAFYRDLLQCAEGRSADTWIDFDFFGHQLSCHVGEVVGDVPCQSGVDGVAVPMPHFGVVLTWDHFHALAERLREHQTDFVIEPQVRFVGEAGEQATMFFRDPSGNALEFKAFKHESEMFKS